MRGLLAFAVGVELFGKVADAVLLIVAEDRKRERLETTRLVVARIVAHSETPSSRKCPGDMGAG
ncbi:MAG: hypothetical protein IPQ17_05070 [Xanthomonadales bacterium]|nr:hypothetical protein [Xanthomonadales bacterium]